MSNKPVLCVYIPAWKNYPEAIEQALSLKSQYSSSTSQAFKLQLICSINAVTEIPPEHTEKLLDAFDEFYHVRATTGDVNINMGFYSALKHESDFLWIVSPDDRVSSSALDTISNKLVTSSNLDFLVSNEEEQVDKEFDVSLDTNWSRLLGEASFGLVSGIVYRLERFKPALHLGLQASFTHWGQLAVLIGSVASNRKLKCRMITASLLYERGDPKVLNSNQFDHNVRNYSGSFFGFISLMSFFPINKKLEVRRWIFANFFKIGMYRQGYYYARPKPLLGLTDLYIFAGNVIKATGLLNSIFFWLAKSIDFRKFRKLWHEVAKKWN